MSGTTFEHDNWTWRARSAY